jgi:alkaline phosphatase D
MTRTGLGLGVLILSTTALGAAVLDRGPVVGGVTATEARIFVKTSAAGEVVLRFGTDPALEGALSTAPVVTSVDKGFTDLLVVSELAPDTTYYLDVVVDGAAQLASPFPSFRTFPADATPRPFKLLVLNDFANPTAAQVVPTFESASQEGAAFAFLGGDTPHKTAPSIDTLAEKRVMFDQIYNGGVAAMAGFVDLILRRMPIVRQWDDHDAGGEDIDRTYPLWAISRQAFEEYTPAYPLPASPGTWQRFSYAHVDFFVLDGRSQRDPNGTPDDAGKSMLDGNDLGAAGQLEWLKTGLQSSTARWKVVFTSVPANPTAKPGDSWGAFKTEWAALRSFLQDHAIGGVILVSGDMHLGGIDDGVASGFPEMVVPPPNLDRRSCGSGKTGKWSEGLYYLKRQACNGYGTVEFLTDPDAVVLEVKDGDGNVRLSHTVF